MADRPRHHGQGQAIMAVGRIDAERLQVIVQGGDERLPVSRSFSQ